METAYEPHEGDTVRVRRYEVTESLDPAQGTLVSDQAGRITSVRRRPDGQADVFRLDAGDCIAAGYVFLGCPGNRSTYLVTVVEPVGGREYCAYGGDAHSSRPCIICGHTREG